MITILKPIVFRMSKNNRIISKWKITKLSQFCLGSYDNQASKINENLKDVFQNEDH